MQGEGICCRPSIADNFPIYAAIYYLVAIYVRARKTERALLGGQVLAFHAFGVKRKTLTPSKTLAPRLDPRCANFGTFQA